MILDGIAEINREPGNVMVEEQYTSQERVERLLNGKSIDRVPFFTFILGFAAKTVGITVAEVYAKPDRSFDAQLRTRELYGYDNDPFFGYASYGAWEFGAKLRFPKGEYQQAPAVEGRLPVETEDDVEKLSLPDVRTVGVLPLAMEFSKLQVKHGMMASVVIGGCFTVAVNIASAGRLCRWMIKKPDLVHRVLRLTTEHLVDVISYWVDSFGGNSVIPHIWEPAASNQIISPRFFEQFVLPYEKELHERILSLGIRHILCHICGEHNQNLPYWSEVPMGDPGIVTLGNEVSIETAKDFFSERCIIAGNIRPSVLQTGTPEQIRRMCKEVIETAKHYPRGFILMPGCEMPVNTPPSNVRAMMESVREYGRYGG
jgi:uroporphyrinogen decarboxylase